MRHHFRAWLLLAAASFILVSAAAADSPVRVFSGAPAEAKEVAAVAEEEHTVTGAKEAAANVHKARAVTGAKEAAANADKARAVTAAGTQSHKGGEGKVYLRSVTALVFSENARSQSRHGTRQPQLQCVGGSAAGLFWGGDRYPRVVQCANVGFDGSSIQWRCEATLEDGLEFGDTHVICEGYDGPGDDYITAGSCRLEYTLNYSHFKVSSVHIIYASVLALGMLWFYWQTRYWIHGHAEKIDREIGEGHRRIADQKGDYPATYGATESPTG